MAGHIPVISGHEAARVFGEFDRRINRQTGSHMMLVKPGNHASLSVPDHREVARGTLRTLIRSAGLTVDEFVSRI